MKATVTSAPIRSAFDALYKCSEAGLAILVVTARNIQYRDITLEYLARDNAIPEATYMRPLFDQRRDEFVKADLYEQILVDGYKPVVAFDDNPAIINLWNERSLHNHTIPGWHEGENPDDFVIGDMPYLRGLYPMK